MLICKRKQKLQDLHSIMHNKLYHIIEVYNVLVIAHQYIPMYSCFLKALSVSLNLF